MRHPLVQDHMTKDVISLRRDTGFKEIARALAERGISGAPVIDTHHRVLGVVSEADLLHKEEFVVVPSEPRRYFESRRARTAREKASADAAGELMTSPAIVVTADTSVPQAARIMADRKVKRLPVVDSSDALVGIITRSDIIGVFLAPDRQIRDQVIAEVIKRSLWADPAEVRVEVADGVVTLSGVLELKTLIPIAVDLTRGIDGVVDVVNELHYQVDNTTPEHQTYWR